MPNVKKVEISPSRDAKCHSCRKKIKFYEIRGVIYCGYKICNSCTKHFLKDGYTFPEEKTKRLIKEERELSKLDRKQRKFAIKKIKALNNLK